LSDEELSGEELSSEELSRNPINNLKKSAFNRITSDFFYIGGQLIRGQLVPSGETVRRPNGPQ
jgi:hypothetical protein